MRDFWVMLILKILLITALIICFAGLAWFTMMGLYALGVVYF